MEIETPLLDGLEPKSDTKGEINEDLVFKKLHICKQCEHPKCNNIIIIFCPSKVGSSSLVTSLNLSLSDKYKTFHLHNENTLKYLYELQDISVIDVINIISKYKKNIHIIDIYRNTFDRMVSYFFHEIHQFFSIKKNEVDTLLDNNKITTRFNELFIFNLSNNMLDYYSELYNNNIKLDNFDFDKKYLKYVEDNKTYIKVRLNDFELWPAIFGEIFNEKIYLLRDNSTNNKSYKTFKNEYKIPNNLSKILLLNMKNEKVYLSETEQEEYVNYINNNTDKTSEVRYFKKEECILYLYIIQQNELNREEKLDKNHYLVTNCNCNKCISNNNEIKEMIDIEIQNDVILDTLIKRKEKRFSSHSNNNHSSCSSCNDKKQKQTSQMQQQTSQMQQQTSQMQQQTSQMQQQTSQMQQQTSKIQKQAPQIQKQAPQQSQQNKHALGRLLFK
jgi:hypothetical protein